MYSFDHDKILDDRIIACNMKKTKLKANSLGVAVFSLHQDWREYSKDANRTLTYLIVAEVTRTLKKSDGEGEGRLFNLKDVLEEEGFRLEDEDTRDRFAFITAGFRFMQLVRLTNNIK